jgi:hypothetical protein
MRRSLSSVAIVIAVIALVAVKAQAAKLTPVGASASSKLAAKPDVVINGAGLGQENGNAEDPTGDFHTNHWEYVCGLASPPCNANTPRNHVPNQWLSGQYDTSGYLEIDLGQDTTLGAGALKIWNFNLTTWTARGLRSLAVEVAPDDGGAALAFGSHPSSAYSSVSHVINDSNGNVVAELTQAPGEHTPAPSLWPNYDYGTPDTIDLSDGAGGTVVGRYIKIKSNGNHGDGNFVGLAEVQVFSAENVIPEPASVMLLGLALIGLVNVRRFRS